MSCDKTETCKSMLTPHEAKLYLAEQLPEKIVIGSTREYFYWRDKDTPLSGLILETEWQQIALWVEEKMFKLQGCTRYYETLDEMCEVKRLEGDFWIDGRHCDYTTRATAMKEAGIKV